MKNKKVGIIFGVLNNSSIAWKIAEVFLAKGFKLIVTYQNENFLPKLSPLLTNENIEAMQCDVSEQKSIDELFATVSQKYEIIDFLVHSIAFSDKNELRGKYLNTSRNNFLNAMNISCFSFTALAQKFSPLMSEGGSILTLTYYGAEKVVPNYNVMGVCKAALESSVRYLAMDLGENYIRVNAISAGVVKTLAAHGIKDINHLARHTKKHSPIKRNIETSEIADTALFLIDDGSRGITGSIIHVDCGYHIVGIPTEENC